MTLIYPHWQHGRLIEGFIPNCVQPLPILTIFLSSGVAEQVILEGLTTGIVSINEALRAVPVVRYELVWFDGKTAYYRMAKRWRE